MKKIVAFHSPSEQSGKSIAADYLVTKRGYSLVKFADPVKSMTYSLIQSVIDDRDLIWDYMEGSKKETIIPVLGVTPRELFVSIGHRWGRGIKEDFWIRLLENRLKKLKNKNIVIDDLRYPNEYNFLKERNAVLIRIVRVGGEQATSESEGLLNEYSFDHTVINNGNIVEFLNKISGLPLD